MPSNFNGIEITNANFNGTELDSIYFNGIEVFSSVDKIPVYSFFGQSNMVGTGGGIANAPYLESGIIPMSKVWNKSTLVWDDFETGVNNGNDFGNYSAITKFAWLRYIEDPNTVKYYFIEAIGGTSMANTWNVNTQHTADLFADYALMLDSGDFETHSIYWLQGESDCALLVDANAYELSESAMIDLYKITLGTSRFVSSKLGYDPLIATSLPYKSIVNTAKENNQTNLHSTFLLGSDNLPLSGDGIHFTTPSYQIIGQRWHDTYFDNGLSKSFKFIVRTTAPNESVTIPISQDGGSSGTINFGDGSALADNLVANRTHSYVVAGDYEIEMDGMIEDFNFSIVPTSKDNIIDITNWGINMWNSFDTMSFINCTNLDNISASDMALQGNMNTTSLFSGIPNLSWGSNSDNWSVESTNLAAMFSGNTNFNSSLSWLRGSFNVSMFQTFANTDLFNQPVIDLCKSSCTIVQGCFFSASVFNQDLDTWDTSSVLDFSSLFWRATVFNSLVPFNTAIATTFTNMFYQATAFNQSLVTFNTSNVTNMSNMFRSAESFNQDISHFDFSSVESMNNFMRGKTNLDYSTTNMDSLLNRLDDATFGLNVGIMTNLTIHFGTIDYTSAGAAALSSLIGKGLSITIGNEV